MTEAEIEVEAAAVAKEKIAALRARWRGRFGEAAPAFRSRDHLARAYIHRLETARAGPVRAALKRRLTDLAARFAADPAHNPAPRAQLRPGAALVRDWNGVRHVVLVTREGFQWRDQTFASLTPIARAITGQHQSGPRFFGLTGTRPFEESAE